VPAPELSSALSAEATLYAQLRETNAQAFRLRRDGQMAEAAALRRGIVEKAKAAWPPGDERVLSFTLDYVEVLLELGEFDQADALLLAAEAGTDATGPAAKRLASITARAQRARGAGAKPASSTTRPVVAAVAVSPDPKPIPTPAATAPGASPAPPAAMGAELSFVDENIGARQYREAEIRLFEMYANAMAGAPDASRQRAIQLALARVYAAWGKPADATRFRERERFLSPATQPVDGQPDLRKLEWLDAMNRQAFALRLQNRLSLAEVLRQRVVTEAKVLLPAGDTRLLAFQIDYVDLLLQMTRYEDAERELLEARKTAGSPQSSPDAARVQRALIRLYEAWGKPERARQVQVGSLSSVH
jgi:tetratricopeptide (TPR) repeat protein